MARMVAGQKPIVSNNHKHYVEQSNVKLLIIFGSAEKVKPGDWAAEQPNYSQQQRRTMYILRHVLHINR